MRQGRHACPRSSDNCKTPTAFSSYRRIDYAYDWRHRRISADGEESFFEKTDYDNLDRVIASYRHYGSESPTNLRAKTETETKYDSMGRVWHTVVFEVRGYTLDASLVTDFWYDARGNLMKVREPSGTFQKSVFDGARRLTNTYVSYDPDETTYSEAGDVDGDIVLDQHAYELDAVGNVLLETRYERKSDWTSADELTTTSGVRYYLASWYDALHRLEAVADYGTNGGSELTDFDPETAGDQGYDDGAPASSDGVLVTSMTYNVTGLLEDTTDPEGNVTRQEYDQLARVIRITSDYGGLARKVELDYNALSQVTKRRTWKASGTGKEETEYVYGVVGGGTRPSSDIASNSLLGLIKYPDPSSGDPSSSSADQESFAYNAQGELVYRKDQNQTVHQYDYDELGRRTADRATTLGTNVDTAVRQLRWMYDALDRVTVVRSYDVAENETDEDVVNEVNLAHNGFGQITESWQEHDGKTHSGTLSAISSYSEAVSDPVSRLKYIQYPGTARKVYVYYDDPSGQTDDAKKDWVMVRPSGISSSSSPESDRIADYTYQGLSRVVSRKATEPTADITLSVGYDQLGRVGTLDASNGSAINDLTYGYDRNSSVVWRDEDVTSGRDESYGYDGLDRLAVFKRGTLTGDPPVISTPSETQSWDLDLVGNWDSFTDGSTIERTHNQSNEITEFDDDDDGIPQYDPSGNTVYIEEPTGGQRELVYDAWNRLVKVKIGGEVAAHIRYDGLGRRIYESVSDRDYYYSGVEWQLLSERDRSEDETVCEYVWGVQYVDEILERDRDTSNPPDGTLDETLFYIQDANWNVITLCNGAGAVVERCRYDPYGLPSFMDGSWGARGASAYGNDILFTGRTWRGQLSFTYDYRHREYSPYLGRFLQRDPIGIWGDAANAGNGYAYAGGRPVGVVDPFGLEGTDFADFHRKLTVALHQAVCEEALSTLTLTGDRGACMKVALKCACKKLTDDWINSALGTLAISALEALPGYRGLAGKAVEEVLAKVFSGELPKKMKGSWTVSFDESDKIAKCCATELGARTGDRWRHPRAYEIPLDIVVEHKKVKASVTKKGLTADCVFCCKDEDGKWVPPEEEPKEPE